MSPVRTVARRTSPALAVALGAALLAAARPAAAQGRVLFDYEGRVDREVTIRVREGQVNVDGGGLFLPTRGPGVRVRTDLPREEGTLRVRVANGRGEVDVVQQPSASNGYAAVVRVRDPQPGADDYRLTAYWTPAGRGGWGDGTWDDRRDDRRDNRRDDRRDDRDGRWDARADERARRRAERDRERWERRRERDERRRDRDGDYDDRGGWGWGRGRGSGDYGSGTLRWSGRVDDVQEIRVRGRRAESFTVSGGGAWDVRSRVDGGLPARDVRVRVTRSAGRGQVQVVEQPSARNDYTAVLRVVDRQGGAGHYDIEASW